MVILENDGDTCLRLASHVHLGPIDWAALAKRRHPTVQKIAKERAASAKAYDAPLRVLRAARRRPHRRGCGVVTGSSLRPWPVPKMTTWRRR